MEAMISQGEQKLQAQVFKHIFGFVDSLVLKCAIELGIFDLIHDAGKPITLSSLVSTLPFPSVNMPNFQRLLMYLVHMGLLQKSIKIEGEGMKEEEYSPTELAAVLLRNGEKSLVAWALAIIDEVDMDCWHDLSKCCYSESSGPTIFELKHGMNVWDFSGKNEEVNRLINNAMASDTEFSMPAFIQGCGDVLKGVGSLVDVGGGTGIAMIMVAEAFPHLKCTVFDLPHVVVTAPFNPTNVSAIGGDMFESVPNADAILLKFMLHNWQDDGCIKILKRCREAVPKVGGKVIIMDIVMDSDDDDDDLVLGKICLDIEMLLTSGGKERTGDEWKMLIKKAGFSGLEIIPIRAIQSVIVAYP